MNKLFLEDLIKAQSEIKPIPKRGKNPHYNSEYAEYDDIVQEVKPILAKYNMFVTHRIITHPDDQGATLTTVIHHSSGELLDSSMPLINKADTDQGMGSSISYAKRYTLTSLLAIATQEDDDGHKATHIHISTEIKNARITGQFNDLANKPAPEPEFEEVMGGDIPSFESLPKQRPTGPFKIPAAVEARLNTGDTEHKDGEPEHRWNANKKYPGTFYCSKKLTDGNWCKEQKVNP